MDNRDDYQGRNIDPNEESRTALTLGHELYACYTRDPGVVRSTSGFGLGEQLLRFAQTRLGILAEIESRWRMANAPATAQSNQVWSVSASPYGLPNSAGIPGVPPRSISAAVSEIAGLSAPPATRSAGPSPSHHAPTLGNRDIKPPESPNRTGSNALENTMPMKSAARRVQSSIRELSQPHAREIESHDVRESPKNIGAAPSLENSSQGGDACGLGSSAVEPRAGLPALGVTSQVVSQTVSGSTVHRSASEVQRPILSRTARQSAQLHRQQSQPASPGNVAGGDAKVFASTPTPGTVMQAVVPKPSSIPSPGTVLEDARNTVVVRSSAPTSGSSPVGIPGAAGAIMHRIPDTQASSIAKENSAQVRIGDRSEKPPSTGSVPLPVKLLLPTPGVPAPTAASAVVKALPASEANPSDSIPSQTGPSLSPPVLAQKHVVGEVVHRKQTDTASGTRSEVRASSPMVPLHRSSGPQSRPAETEIPIAPANSSTNQPGEMLRSHVAHPQEEKVTDVVRTTDANPPAPPAMLDMHQRAAAAGLNSVRASSLESRLQPDEARYESFPEMQHHRPGISAENLSTTGIASVQPVLRLDTRHEGIDGTKQSESEEHNDSAGVVRASIEKQTLPSITLAVRNIATAELQDSPRSIPASAGVGGSHVSSALPARGSVRGSTMPTAANVIHRSASGSTGTVEQRERSAAHPNPSSTSPVVKASQISTGNRVPPIHRIVGNAELAGGRDTPTVHALGRSSIPSGDNNRFSQSSPRPGFVQRSAAGTPGVTPPATLPAMSALPAASGGEGSQQASPAVNINQLANRVYEMLVRRLASEHQRGGG